MSKLALFPIPTPPLLLIRVTQLGLVLGSPVLLLLLLPRLLPLFLGLVPLPRFSFETFCSSPSREPPPPLFPFPPPFLPNSSFPLPKFHHCWSLVWTRKSKSLTP